MMKFHGGAVFLAFFMCALGSSDLYADIYRYASVTSSCNMLFNLMDANNKTGNNREVILEELRDFVGNGGDINSNLDCEDLLVKNSSLYKEIFLLADYDMAKILLDSGANPNQRFEGYVVLSPLIAVIATFSNRLYSTQLSEPGYQLQIIHLLFDYGASVDKVYFSKKSERMCESATMELMQAIGFLEKKNAIYSVDKKNMVLTEMYEALGFLVEKTKSINEPFCEFAGMKQTPYSLSLLLKSSVMCRIVANKKEEFNCKF